MSAQPPSNPATPHPTATDGVWRVMRFEATDGKWAEIASNRVGPEAIALPPGYAFVRSTPMVPLADAEALARAVSAHLGPPCSGSPLRDALSEYLSKHPWSDL